MHMRMHKPYKRLSPVCLPRSGIVRKKGCRSNTGEKYISYYERWVGNCRQELLRVEVNGFQGGGRWKSNPTPVRLLRRYVFISKDRPYEKALAEAVGLRDEALGSC